MVDGISFLTTGVNRESTNAERANKSNDDRNATFGVTTASDAAALALDKTGPLNDTATNANRAPQVQSSATSTAPTALLSASSSNVLIDDQAKRSAPTPDDTNRLEPPTRTKQQVETAVKAFDDTQSRNASTAPAEKPQYFNASVRISV